jgi:hypothetical protein
MQPKIKNARSVFTLCLFLIGSVVFIQCSEEEMTVQVPDPYDTIKVSTMNTTAVGCSSCKYVVPANVTLVDGKILGIKPGDMICLSASVKYTNTLTFKNIVGTADKPVIITNCGGTVNLTVSGRPFNVKFSASKFFRFTGGNTNNVYGIRMSGSTSNGLVLCELSTNFTVDHVEIFNVGFAGIMAKTDPTCDNATIRGNFTMRDVVISHNYVHDTGGEGLYVGHSFYEGYTISCGTRLPHIIENIRIHDNRVKNAGWDGIQLCSAPVGAQVYNNTVEDFGRANKADQNYGILLGGGTGGSCYNNFIKGGTGTSLTAFGIGDNLLHNNIIVNSAKVGIFVDERTTLVGQGYRIINNTIINPKGEGMRIYAERVPKNIVINNIIVNPGSFSTYGTVSYVMTLNKMTNTEIANNYTTRNIGDVKFVNPGAFNYRLTSASPTINKGKSISTYNIATDFYNATRLKGTAYDIGASEY